MKKKQSQKQSSHRKRGQKICLNMIVKNESAVIRRCLESVKPFIQYWVIVDTGSTDGTQDIIKKYMKDIPGELHEHPWVDFAHNRNIALELAKDKGTYLLLIDADDVLEPTKRFVMPVLNKDLYYVVTKISGVKYHEVKLVNTQLDWQWKGALHEAIMCPEAKTHDTLENIYTIRHTDGARAKDPERFARDVAILRAAVRKEPNNSRHVFYLAQTYNWEGKHKLALKYYTQRTMMGGWAEEVFISLLQIARVQEKLEMDPQIIKKSYYKAFKYRPSRSEPLCYLACYCRKHGDYNAAYEAARLGLSISFSKDYLLVEAWIYEYDMLLEYSLAAYGTERYTEALIATDLLLSKPLPKHVRELVKKNRRTCQTQVHTRSHPKRLVRLLNNP